MRSPVLRFTAVPFRLAAFLFILSLTVGSAFAQGSKSVGLLKGEVMLANGSALSGVSFTIFKGTEKLTTTRSNPDGKITSILQPNATYRVAVTSTGYMYHEDTVRVPVLDAYQEIPLRIVLTPLVNGQMFDLPQPVFQPKSRDINSAAIADLDRIANEMKHNPKLSVAVRVYPDAPVKSKKDAAEQKLAAARETSMRSYFLGRSIPASRFTVESVTSTIPPGRFHSGASTEAPSKKKKKGSTSTPAMYPQYVEITAHVAP